MIGCLRWAIDLVRSDIATEVSLMSRHLSLPHSGHLDQCFNIYTYLKKHTYYKLVMNPDYVNMKNKFGKLFNKEAEWFGFYSDAKE